MPMLYTSGTVPRYTNEMQCDPSARVAKKQPDGRGGLFHN
jgi:hypothetical protein